MSGKISNIKSYYFQHTLLVLHEALAKNCSVDRGKHTWFYCSYVSSFLPTFCLLNSSCLTSNSIPIYTLMAEMKQWIHATASGYLSVSSLAHSHSVFSVKPHTLCSDCQGLTLPPLLISTVDTTYCNVVPNVCHKSNQFILCDISIQNFPIRGLGSIGGNVDEIEISTASLAQCPAQSHIHSSTSISREVNAGEGGDRGWT